MNRELAAQVPLDRTPYMRPAPVTPEAPTREDTPFIARRLMVLFLIITVVVVVFGLRIYRLTIIEGGSFREFSEKNFLLETPIIAPRGRILDRNGMPLAINNPFFDVEMSPFKLKPAEIAKTLDRLATLLGRPQIRGKAGQIAHLYPKWKSVSLLGRNLLTLNDVLPLMEQSFELPGVIITPEYQRYYPEGAVAGSITGHVAAINKDKLESFLEQGYLRTEKVGHLGAEKTFESLLHGQHGIELVTRDAQGRPRDRYVSQSAKPGNILVLTIDMGLQRLADSLLDGFNGAILAMDPRDGSVLAMAARPNYDPNSPAAPHSPTGVPYNSYNKIARGVFPPGSTFKVVTAAAGLNAGLTPDDSANCGGYIVMWGVKFPCHWRPGHGTVDLYEALQKSCNIFFYRWANIVGAEQLIDAASDLGFGERTGFELVDPAQESPGVLAQPGVTKIYPGNVLHMGIGQGSLIGVTMLQMARSYAAICNGGILYQPRIIKEVHGPDGKQVIRKRLENGEEVHLGEPIEQGRINLSDENRKAILEGLWRVVHVQGGTGSHSQIKEKWNVAGKTGTAQTGIPNKPSNAWFACFAPAENPEILLVIMIEQGGHGGDVAAPLARQLLAYYYGEPELKIVPPGAVPHKTVGGD